VEYPIPKAIEDFDSMMQQVAARVAQKPDYLSVKGYWPEYLKFLQPLVAGRSGLGNDHLRFREVHTDLTRNLTSIEDEELPEKALYFGAMAASILEVVKRRYDFPKIDFNELSELWIAKALYPMQALKETDFFENVNPNAIDALLQGFLRLHVVNRLKDSSKMNDAISHFETQFFSGILLGHIVTYLILRLHYKGT
jgi:hypothetical protein